MSRGQPAVTRRGYSTSDAAAYLGMSPHTLEDWRRRGVGPSYRRVGTGTRPRALYMIEDLDTYLDNLEFVGGGVSKR